MRRQATIALAMATGLLVGSTAATVPAAAGRPQQAPDPIDPVLLWNEVAAEAAVVGGIAPDFDPLHESRMYAMVHLAIHDALNAIDRRFEPYAMDMPVTFPDASVAAAAAVAASEVMLPVIAEFPLDLAPDIDGATAVVEAAYEAAIDDVPDGDAKEEGMALGHAAATVVLAMRTNDRSDETFLDRKYPEGDDPGEYRFPTNGPFAAAPTWGEVTPFTVADIEAIRPRPPHRLDSRQYAKDFDELKLMGERVTDARDEYETETAFFWRESSPLRWNRIARTLLADRTLDEWEHARLFALLNMALADGYIANWDVKYLYNRWRPETAIHLGGEYDTNPRTVGDEDWLPLQDNGATPEYDSGHSIEGAAAAEVMRRVLGTDRVTFEVCSLSMPDDADECGGATPAERTYTRLTDASAENGWSRILLGWHFRNAVEVGTQRGRSLGAEAVRNLLGPVH